MDQKSAADHSFDVSIHAFILFMTMRLLHLALAAGESAVLEKYLIEIILDYIDSLLWSSK